jgi:hypothetical protein
MTAGPEPQRPPATPGQSRRPMPWPMRAAAAVYGLWLLGLAVLAVIHKVGH